MPVVNRIAAFSEDMAAWRKHLHAHPELGFDCHETASFVVEKLRAWGVDEIHEGIAQSGVVAVINGQGEGTRTVGLRADMDALPMQERTGLPHASTVPGRMHACGHDGHTTMLLGAARYLAETRNFAGRVVLIFQPAEEQGGGAGVMVEDGVLERFGITDVFALHTLPGRPEGHLVTTPGAIMAAVDSFEVFLEGVGGHAAMPHQTTDPIVALLSIGQALQTIVTRNADPLQEVVVGLTQVHAGTNDNVTPGSAYMCGTVRTFDPDLRDLVERRMGEIVEGIGRAHGVSARLAFGHSYPATVNDPGSTDFAMDVAREVAGADGVTSEGAREMGAEDFSYMLEKLPGCYLFLGQGNGPKLHNDGFDFNDTVAPVGASFFARLVERAQPLD